MIAFLVEHGLELALGITIVLAAGALATALSRGAIQRHQLARLTLVAAWCAALLLALPLPRPARFEIGRPVLLRPVPVQVAVQVPVQVTDAPVALAPILRSLPIQWAVQGERAAPPAPAPPVDLGPWLARMFLAGAAAFAFHLLVCMAVLRRTLRRARPAPARVAEPIERWARAAGVRARVLVSADVTRPFCCGVTRGTIVFPVDLAAPEHAQGAEAVARHELAHLTQRHPAARLVAAMSAPLLYWNPLYWWLARELRRSAELLADDAAVVSLDKRRYVSELLSLAERSRTSTLALPAPGLGVLGSRRDFLRRMETLLMRHDRLPTSTSRRHLAARCFGAALVLSTVSVAWGHTPQESVTRSTDLEQQAERAGGSVPMLSSIPLLGSLLAADPPAAGASTPQATSAEELAALSGLGYVAYRSAPAPAPVWLDCELEVRNATALGRFVYAAGDAQLSLESFTLAQGGGEQRIARFAVKQASLPELALVARSTDGVQVLSARVCVVAAATATDAGLVLAIRGSITGIGRLDGMPILTINRGKDEGVRSGTTFEIYAESKYKGRAEVISVHSHECTAKVTLTVRRGWMGTGDSATTQL